MMEKCRSGSQCDLARIGSPAEAQILLDAGSASTCGFDETALRELLHQGLPAEEGALEGLRDSLMPLVVGLRRTGRLPAVLAAYRDAVGLRTKTFVRWVPVSCWGGIGCIKKRTMMIMVGVHTAVRTQPEGCFFCCREVVERGVPVLLSSDRRDMEQMSIADKLQVRMPVSLDCTLPSRLCSG